MVNIIPAAPIYAQPVVVVGGPTGPSGGPTGPTGPHGAILDVVPGPTGPTGSQGAPGVVNTVVINSLTPTPAGTTSGSGVMLGLSSTITPAATGRVMVWINGVASQTNSNNNAAYEIRYGTGTPPANGAVPVGTKISGQLVTNFSSGLTSTSFSIQGFMQGLTLGAPVWLDILLSAPRGGTATMTEVQLNAFEL